MRRCAIDINNGQPGHNHPVEAVNAYISGPPTDINKLKFNTIPVLQSFLRRHKITREYLPHVDKLSTIQRVNLAIFGCQVRLLGIDKDEALDEALIDYIADQMEGLEDLANRLEQGRRLSRQQQAFVNGITSGGGNGPYWLWFMELRCAVAVVESGM
ncbi:hypothetical protein FNYG_14958 [Fusarium nygamai]|uniref:Uncharacterized protein n=1 Tax=Gibberella nygamai TaxID=42673 RepID=A0A2K0UNF2_GIBNY|nr:hypothetical protein FNYG_14958 [Fusarium nygamai]